MIIWMCGVPVEEQLPQGQVSLSKILLTRCYLLSWGDKLYVPGRMASHELKKLWKCTQIWVNYPLLISVTECLCYTTLGLTQPAVIHCLLRCCAWCCLYLWFSGFYSISNVVYEGCYESNISYLIILVHNIKGEVIQSSIIFVSLICTHSNISSSGVPRAGCSGRYSQERSTGGESLWKAASYPSLLVFKTESTHCQFTSSFSSTSTPKSFFGGLLLIILLTQLVFTFGIVPIQMQHFTLVFAECHDVHMDQPLKPVKVPSLCYIPNSLNPANFLVVYQSCCAPWQLQLEIPSGHRWSWIFFTEWA